MVRLEKQVPSLFSDDLTTDGKQPGNASWYNTAPSAELEIRNANHLHHHWLWRYTHRWFHSRDCKKLIMWWVNLCCFTVCLQVCWVSNFLARYNTRYVTEKSSTDTKSIAWIRYASNFVLLRNLQVTLESKQTTLSALHHACLLHLQNGDACSPVTAKLSFYSSLFENRYYIHCILHLVIFTV